MVRQTSELPAQRRCEVLLLNTNGYPAGQDTKIPLGRIVCDSTFDSLMVSMERSGFILPAA